MGEAAVLHLKRIHLLTVFHLSSVISLMILRFLVF